LWAPSLRWTLPSWVLTMDSGDRDLAPMVMAR